MNPVVVGVCVMLLLALMRVNVVVALTFSAVVGGLVGGLSLSETVSAFEGGLGDGATIALSYAMLGAFAVAVGRSGITDVIAKKMIAKISTDQHLSSSEDGVNADSFVHSTRKKEIFLKYSILVTIGILAMSSQNVIPVHIAFIPILIPPLLHIFAKLKMDRRLIACVLTFGLITPYMTLPIGFGGIFLNNILLKNLNENGLEVTASQVPYAMILPALGMVIGLLIAVFFSYRKPREYSEEKILAAEPEKIAFQQRHIIVAGIATVATMAGQLISGSMIIGGLIGFIIFIIGGVIRWKDTQDVFTRGVHMMAMIGFIMISAAGFAAVMKATGGVETLVTSVSHFIGDNKGLAALLMLIVGLLVTMGIGSSFSTIPILATIYVPLANEFGFSAMATIALIGAAAALGDAGSPASDSTLGPTSGLNADNQHDHIWDTVIPTFIHYNLPLIAFGWLGAMVL